VFELFDVERSADGAELAARCRVDPDWPGFAGHFPGRPLLPAVAQLRLAEALAQRAGGGAVRLRGGATFKCLKPVLPGDTLQLRLQRLATGNFRFTLSDADGVKSRGTLQFDGAALA